MKTQMRPGTCRSGVTTYANNTENPLTVPNRNATIIANEACRSSAGGRQRDAETQLASTTSSRARKPTSPIVPTAWPASTPFSGITDAWL